MSVLLQPSISQPCLEIHCPSIHLVPGIGSVASLLVQCIGHATQYRVWIIIIHCLPFLNQQIYFSGSEFPSGNTNYDLALCLDMDVLPQDQLPGINNHLSYGIISPGASALGPQVIRNSHRNLGLLLEKLVEQLDNSKVLGDQLGDLWEEEMNQPSGYISLTLGLIVAQDKKHLPIMQEQVLGGQHGIPPSEPQELGLTPLLARPKEEQNQECLEKFLDCILILLRSISRHNLMTLSCLQPEYIEQNQGLPYISNQPVLHQI